MQEEGKAEIVPGVLFIHEVRCSWTSLLPLACCLPRRQEGREGGDQCRLSILNPTRLAPPRCNPNLATKLAVSWCRCTVGHGVLLLPSPPHALPLWLPLKDAPCESADHRWLITCWRWSASPSSSMLAGLRPLHFL